ncbi:hypothetical protein NC652_001079 [Populus alba x Populus x berolinensis]|nr:hypothetical protein NC652_001079 [Populus alba x Populus x berolinensis]
MEGILCKLKHLKILNRAEIGSERKKMESEGAIKIMSRGEIQAPVTKYHDEFHFSHGGRAREIMRRHRVSEEIASVKVCLLNQTNFP